MAAVHSDVRKYIFGRAFFAKKYVDFNCFMNVKACSEYSASFKTIFTIEDQILGWKTPRTLIVVVVVHYDKPDHVTLKGDRSR